LPEAIISPQRPIKRAGLSRILQLYEQALSRQGVAWIVIPDHQTITFAVAGFFLVSRRATRESKTTCGQRKVFRREPAGHLHATVKRTRITAALD
jgi:hypothetical protein